MRSIETPRPLVVFSALSTMASGSWIILGIFNVMEVYPAGSYRSSLAMLLASLMLLVVAFACSTTHLGSPEKCFSAFNRAGSSNLSNEVLNGFLLVLFAFVYLAVCYSKVLDTSIDAVLAMLSILMATLFLFVSCRAYRMPTVPTWNSVSFSLGFIVDAELGGCMFVAGISVIAGGYEMSVMSVLLSCAVLGFIFSGVLSVIQMSKVAASFNDWQDVFQKAEIWGKLTALRVALQGVGVFTVLIGFLASLGAFAWVVGLLLVVAGIIVERYLFYCGYNGVGLPR